MRFAHASRLCLLSLVPSLLLSAALAQEKKDEKPRFIDRGEYIEDTSTKLLWQKDGATAGKKNFQQAAEYAKGLKLGGLQGWRVPTAKELAGIFPADQKPFLNSKYNPEMCCGRPKEFASFWTSELDVRLDDYAFVYQWYAKGGANNCFASKNFVYVRCVRDVDGTELAAEVKPAITKLDDETLAKVKSLIKQLADEDFQKRESATKELITLGAVLVDLLKDEQVKSTDFEVKLRLKRILGAITAQ
jgi:hypothetical protein